LTHEQARQSEGNSAQMDVTAYGNQGPMRPVPVTLQVGSRAFAVLMLALPIIGALIINFTQLDRTVMLLIQCAVWAAVTPLIVSTGRRHAWKLPRNPTRITQLLVLFLCALALATWLVWLSNTRSDMKALGLQTAALIFMALPFYPLRRLAATAPVDSLGLAICHVVLALGLYSVVGDFLGVNAHAGVFGRYFGPLGDQVAWVLTLPFVVYFSSRRIFLALLAALGLVLTASRGPVLTTIAALLLLLVFSRGRRFEHAALVVILLVIGLYQAGLFSTLLHRFSATEFTNNDRTVTAALGIKIFLKSPVFGSGYNSLTHFYPSTMHRISQGILPAQTSTFVQMLSDGGVILFLPYLCFVLAASKAGVRLMRHSSALTEGRILTGIAAWLVAILWVNQSALWFVVGSYLGPLVFGMAGVVAGAVLRHALVQFTGEPIVTRNSQFLSSTRMVGE
jgi:O-antigen ligase